MNVELRQANYEARKFGIRAGMFIGKAKELCANLITLPYEFDKYSSTAEAMYRHVFLVTPHVRALTPTRVHHTHTRTPINTQCWRASHQAGGLARC